MTSETSEFTECFKSTNSFQSQASQWHRTFKKSLKKSFKKVRVTNRKSKKNTAIDKLMEKRRLFIKNNNLTEKTNIEEEIAKYCEDANRIKVRENFGRLESENGNVSHQSIWTIKKKVFPKIKPTIQTGKRNLVDKLITNPTELKELYLKSFMFRLRHRPSEPGFESI